MMSTFYMNTIDSIKMAVQHPFGLDFEIHNKKIYIPVGSAINFLGYNDFLERVIGVVRVVLALVALIYSNDYKERLIAGGHIFRGILEMVGSFEGVLLILDVVFTIYNVGNRIFNRNNQIDPLINAPVL
jgi:hypothetical protein